MTVRGEAHLVGYALNGAWRNAMLAYMDRQQDPSSDSRSFIPKPPVGNISSASLSPHASRVPRARHYARIAILSVAAIAISSGIAYSFLFGPAASVGASAQFLVEPGEDIPAVAQELKETGIVKSRWVAQLVLASAVGENGIRPGAYEVSPKMDLLAVMKTLTSMPSLVFVTIPPSVRKEEIGAQLAEELFWGPEQVAEWEDATSVASGLPEGVYYPDTYLIPTDQPPAQIAARLRGRFTDVFAKYAQEAKEKGLAWDDVLTLASIVDREASKTDRELVAGILWNRIETGMKLQADATLQYAVGEEGSWWAAPKAEYKYVDSPFNTYKYAGLPPHPINNPTVESVEAVLNPQQTGCMFYLHDNDHQIHCSLTYAGQKANVERYLR